MSRPDTPTVDTGKLAGTIRGSFFELKNEY